MVRKFIFVFYIFYWLLIPIIISEAQEDTYTFLIQDRWGVIVGLSIDETGAVQEPEIVRGMTESPRNPQIVDLETLSNGGYQLTSEGVLVPLGEAKIPRSFWTPLSQSTKFAMDPEGKGMWIATADHLKIRGKPPQVVLPPSLHHGKQVTDLEYDKKNNRLLVLFEDGHISICYASTIDQVNTLTLDDDQAIDIEMTEKGFLVLTKQARLFYVNSETASPIPNLPELGEGLVRDIELSPFGVGFYLLDAFGVIHACQGAVEIQTEPLLQDAAIDLEILPLSHPPKWYPTGRNTKVRLEPDELLLDPIGPSRKMSLRIDEAENISGYIAELHYDPQLIRIESSEVQVGQWWESAIQGAMVQANIDYEEGVLFLAGGGSILPYDGATGSGEIARIAVSAATKTHFATTTVELTSFHIREVFPGDQYRAAEVVNSATISIQPIQPKIEAIWQNENHSQQIKKTKPGEIIRLDLLVENGSRIKEIGFDLLFTKERITFLGMSLGDAWNREISLDTHFSIPSQANKDGQLKNQRIQADVAGACDDEKGSVVVLFFAVRDTGKAEIAFKNLQATDDQGRNLEIKFIRESLYLESQ